MDMSHKEIVGKQIKKARRAKTLSQKQLAEKVGISRMMISRYEVGSSEVPIERLQKISTILDKPVSFFFGEEQVQENHKVWEEAQKYLDLFKDKVGGELDLSPKEMLAFSLGKGANIKEALEEAKIMMKNWYIANNLQKSTNKSFEEWWDHTNKK
jgi:transcriptional regulator with XRE-family HTH domain